MFDIMIHKLNKNFMGRGEVKDFIFAQVYESENGYVYKVDTNNGRCHYEAFLKKNTPLCIDFENRVYSETERKEMYPKSRDFGVWAWSCDSLDKGISKI